ncbi:MAG: type II secretion system protein GspL [Gammaproteobacteria bacterium]|nr:type II secretion system protein GspL [Gammaproteobacteria bacterium]
MPTLFLRVLSPVERLEEGFAIGCEWLIVEDDGQERAQGVTDYRGLADLADPNVDWLRTPTNIVVLVPSEHVLGVSCTVPGRSIGQIRRALPYVVEEYVATDIEGMHVASAAIKRGAVIHCCLIDRDLLQGWLDCFASLGIVPGFMVPDAELLPAEAGTACVLLDGDSALVRTSDQAATLDRTNLLMALGSLELHRLTMINGELTDIERSQLDAGIEVESAASGEGAILTYLASRWPEQPSAINLLQGEYTPSLPRDPSMERWRSVATLAGICVLIMLLTVTVEGFWSSTQANSLEQRSLALYRDIFPQDRTATPASIRRRVQSRLGVRVTSDHKGMVEFIGDLAGVVDSSMTILGIDYNDARSELNTELLMRRYEDVDRLREGLTSRGVDTEITSAEQADGGVRARLRLRAM